MRMRQTFGLSLALLLAAATAMAKPVHPGDDAKAKPAKAAAGKQAAPAKAKTAVKTAAAKPADKRHPEHAKRVAAAATRHAAAAHKPARAGERRVVEARLPPPDQYIGPLNVVGPREIGAAAWYGGYHIGKRTASGDRLDAVRLTCAHRSLPLHSLVRVTNLNNGRSVVAMITDRGPVSPKLLIDVSPRVADGLDMRRAGIVQVTVEPVAAAR